jgi:preprotein translocase subunit SecD
MMQLLARTRFFGDGHPMSGMDPRQLGVTEATYRGALGIDLERAQRDGTKKGSFKEAKRRQKQVDRREASRSGLTLAERKAQEAREAQESDTDAEAGDNR